MSIEAFVVANSALAYLVLFAGMFIEGEVFFLTAAIFALEGHLEWGWIALAAFAGVILGDIAWYFLGRYSKSTRLGGWVSNKFVAYQDWLSENFMTRYTRLAFFSKFLYYVNRLTPLMAGWQNMKFKSFLKVHLIAGVAWLVTMLVAGRLFGLLAEVIGVDVIADRLYWVFGGIAILIIGGELLLKKLFVKKINK